MPPAGEGYFSTEFFTNLNGTCPHVDKFTPIADMEHGFYVAERMVATLWCIPYFILWVLLRRFTKPLLVNAAHLCGVKKRKVAEKFGYQLWLGTYYLASTLLGIYGYKDESWFQFPIGNSACFNLFGNHPPRPSDFMEFAYQYQLGFYFAELLAIFVEPRRSDFAEYVMHHCTTILLVALSSFALQVRVGCYVFFIHDVPDIFLCFAKCFHYIKKELMVNVLFVLFVATFFFNRLICLPSCTYCIYCDTPLHFDETYSFHILAFLLGFALQALHVFWFALILRMIVRLATGVKGDVRSDSDGDEPEAEGRKTQARVSTKKD
jgi:hypothetical protein